MKRRIANQRQKSSTAIFLVIISVMFLMLVGLSFAYFSDTKTATNELTFGKLQIEFKDGVGQKSKTIELKATGGNGITDDNGTYWIDPSDKLVLNGSVGLEDGSMSGYIRMKIKVTDSSGQILDAPNFCSALMAEMAKIVYTKDSATTMRWFVVGDYMYLGNVLNANEIFAYNSENVNIETNAAWANTIPLTKEIMTGEIQGKTVNISFVYQAIQSAGMKDTSGKDLQLLSGYKQENASKIDALEAWMPFNLEEYSLGTWTAPTHVENAMDARGTFNKGAQKEGKYTHIEFGTYPQTFYSTSSEGLTLTDETYTLYNNAKDNAGIKKDYKVYKDASGNKYVEITTVRSSFEKGWKYSDNTTYIEGSTTTAYFKLEPIIWEIIGVADSKNEIRRGGYDGKTAGVKLLLNSVKELTAMKFGETNAYANSTIKSYLEGEFYTYAFTSEEKSKISKKAIVTTDKTTIGNEDTNSTVFLLSYKDLNTTYYTSNKARIKWPTDYAGANFADRRINEANYGGKYWSRSMYESNTDAAYCVDEDGNSMSYGFSGLNVKYGVVPALFLNIQ